MSINLFSPKYVLKNKDTDKIKQLKKQLRKKINVVEDINWNRTQELHDLAYEIIERKIIKTFPAPDYDLKKETDEFDNQDTLIFGNTYLMNKILKWRPSKPDNEWTDLEKEMVHIMIVKEKIISQKMLIYIYKNI